MGVICFFNTAIAWGGGEKWHLEASLHLKNKGYKVLAVAHKKSVFSERLAENNIAHETVAINNLSFLNPVKYIQIRKLFRKHKIETIVLNLSRDLKIAGPCAKSVGAKRIIYRRGSAIPIKNTFLNRHYFTNVITEILANSEATKKTVLQNNVNLFPAEKIKVIYNGINVKPKPKKVVDNRQSKNQVLTLVNLGRLEAQKNQGFLIRLARELKNRKLPFKIIIGGEGRLKTNLEKQIEELNVEDVVELKGFVQNPLEFMRRGDVFVLPSLWEGFGYVLAEAALCQKPIVAFDLSSNPELVVHKKTGILVKPDNLPEFADAIVWLHQNPKALKDLGKQGFEHVQRHFDKKKKLQEIEEYLLDG